MIRATLLSATLFLSVVGSAQAQKRSLPIGVWGHDGPKGPNCTKPFLKIEAKRIVQRFDEGEGRCEIKSIRKKSTTLFLKTKCEWDASVPENLREGADDEDAESFSIKLVSKNEILFSNTEFGLCPPAVGGAQ